MSFRLRDGHRVFVYSEYVDMRAGFERLSFYVREKMRQNLLEGDLFLFVGKSRRLLKGICYDGTGLLLVGKRLEQGRFMRLEELEENRECPEFCVTGFNRLVSVHAEEADTETEERKPENGISTRSAIRRKAL